MVDWEAVFWEQTPRLYNFFRYRTGNSEAAKDLTSRTMERAWRYRDRYRRDLGAFEAWLFQIARNLAADDLAENQTVEVPFDALHELAAEYSLEQEVHQRQMEARLYTLLQTLSRREQEIIALKYGAGMNNRAIARVLDLSESNVGTILHRIIHKLRVEWDEYDYEKQ